ncbi:hypothetical protein FBY33_2892 [Arthrobacter sp. SLBN-112]|jgi:hypothetical protein|nr:hypothetical protein FBY33_2892 [Arthrobacter sp. SLBN-112]
MNHRSRKTLMTIVYCPPVLPVADRPQSISALAAMRVAVLQETDSWTDKVPSAAFCESVKNPGNAHPVGGSRP